MITTDGWLPHFDWDETLANSDYTIKLYVTFNNM